MSTPNDFQSGPGSPIRMAAVQAAATVVSRFDADTSKAIVEREFRRMALVAESVLMEGGE